MQCTKAAETRVVHGSGQGRNDKPDRGSVCEKHSPVYGNRVRVRAGHPMQNKNKIPCRYTFSFGVLLY